MAHVAHLLIFSGRSGRDGFVLNIFIIITNYMFHILGFKYYVVIDRQRAEIPK